MRKSLGRYSRMRLYNLVASGVLTVASAACYERAPRWGSLAGIADSLLPDALILGCRVQDLELPGNPVFHGCAGAETAILVDRWGRVQRVIRHERPKDQSVLQHYQIRVTQLAAQLGPGKPVCFSENGRWPGGRTWQSTEYWVYVTPAIDTAEVELVWALGTPRFTTGCLGA